jgi:maleate cis-trans isomerase
MDHEHLGFLFPGHSAEDDYPRMASMVQPHVSVEVVETTILEDAHREDALRDVGDVKTLLVGAAVLREHGVTAAMWACTSGSFVFGLQGAIEQARQVEQFLGVPTSSTSLAFVAACKHLGIERVSIAATYPEDIAAMFKQLLADCEIEVVQVSGLGIITAAEVGTLGRDHVIALARANDHHAAQAILIPDTALHTAEWLDDLETAVGKPVLTANQVTMWQALQLAGRTEAQGALGSLFRAPSVAQAVELPQPTAWSFWRA